MKHEVIFENDPVIQPFESIFIAYHHPKFNDEVQQKENTNNDVQ